VFSDNLATSMAVQGEANDAPLRLPVSGALGQLMALGAISTEVLSPLALFGRWPRRVMVAAMLSLLVAIRLFLSPDFLMLASVFVFWVPWEGLRTRLQRTSPAPDNRSTT